MWGWHAGSHGLQTRGRETKAPAEGSEWTGLQRTQMTSDESDTQYNTQTHSKTSLHAKILTIMYLF